MEKIGIDGRVIPTNGQFKSFDNGGKGSGNFGHAGRPGEVGGSAPAGNGQSKTDPEEKKEIKGGTKAEHEAIMEMVKSYAVDERGIDGVYEDVEAAAYPHEDHTTFQKAKRWLEAGGGEVSYEGAYKTLKDLYGDSFKPETYLTKGGDEENGDWKYKDGQPYVWSTYLYKFAKAIADEMDKRKRENSLEGMVVNAVIEALNGGKGSGNFGHAGRPGEVGGSAPAGTSSASSDGDDIKKKLARLEELEKKDREEELNADEIDELHDLTYDKDVKYALSHPEKKSAKEKFKLSQKEADAVSDVLPGLHASDNVGRNIITSQEKREAKAFVREASKEELADKFYDKNTTARERAALYWAMGDEYNFRGVGYVGDDLLYGDKQAFLTSSARKKEHKKPSQGAELYKKIGESQKRAEKQEAIVKGFEKAAKAMDKLEKAFKKAKAGGSKADLTELVYDAQERVTDLYFLDDMKKADQKDRADYDKKQRELAVEIYKFTTGKEPKKMPPSRDEDIHFWGY